MLYATEEVLVVVEVAEERGKKKKKRIATSTAVSNIVVTILSYELPFGQIQKQHHHFYYPIKSTRSITKGSTKQKWQY